MMPPILGARIATWEAKQEPSLAAKQEMADYLWELYDKGALSVPLNPALTTTLNNVQREKNRIQPTPWAKIDEEWQEMLDEAKPDQNVERWHIKDKLDQPLNENGWQFLLAGLRWPFMPVAQFLTYSALKLDGRLRYQMANPHQDNAGRKKDLKEYETKAAKFVFNVVG